MAGQSDKESKVFSLKVRSNVLIRELTATLEALHKLDQPSFKCYKTVATTAINRIDEVEEVIDEKTVDAI